MPRSPGQRRSRAQEIRGAKEFGGQRNPGSGNGWIHKADVRTPRFLIEYKTTKFDSYQLKLTQLRTLEREALLADREPVFIIEFSGHEYVILTKDLFHTLIGDEACA